MRIIKARLTPLLLAHVLTTARIVEILTILTDLCLDQRARIVRLASTRNIPPDRSNNED